MRSSLFINRNFFYGIIFLVLIFFSMAFLAYLAFNSSIGIFGFILLLLISFRVIPLAQHKFENWRLKKISQRFQQFVQEQPVAFSFAVTNDEQKGYLLITEKSMSFLPKKGNPICISYEVLLHHNWDVVHLSTNDSFLMNFFNSEKSAPTLTVARLILESMNEQLSHDKITFYFQPNKKFKKEFDKHVYTTLPSLAIDYFKSTNKNTY